MGMPIREKQLLQHTYTDIPAPFGSMTWIPFGSGGPERVTTAPPGPHGWSLSRTMMTAPSGPHGSLFHTVKIAPSGPHGL